MCALNHVREKQKCKCRRVICRSQAPDHVALPTPRGRTAQGTDRVGAGTARAALPTQQAAVAVVQSEGDQGKAGERAAGVGERDP